MALRNWAFDHEVLEQRQAPFPVVSVGNLAVGGTGKTPMVELLVRLLREAGRHPAVLSRGYGRATKGPLVASAESTAADIGDEPLQIFRKFRGEVPVAVSEDRRRALPLLSALPWGRSEGGVLILDDAFQHRYIARNCNILLTDWHRLYTRDRVLPFGRLREWRSGARRADIVVVTKCPATLTAEEAEAVRRELHLEERQRLFFASIAYAPLPPGVRESGEASLITGIAQPQPLIDHLTAAGVRIIRHLRFPDHHNFSAADLRAVTSLQGPVLTTEKDAMRLPAGTAIPLPIAPAILFNQETDLRQAILKLC